jgi:hypothetical protein
MAVGARREAGIGGLLPSPPPRGRVVHPTGDISRVHSHRWECRASIGWWRDRVKYTKDRGPVGALGVETRPQLLSLVLTTSDGLQAARSRHGPTLDTPPALAWLSSSRVTIEGNGYGDAGAAGSRPIRAKPRHDLRYTRVHLS